MYRENKTINQEDIVLVKQFLANEKDAFDTLVTKYKDQVFNLCYRFLGDYEEANDCAQETFVKVYRFLKKFNFQSSFYTWLYRITINTCKNKFASFKYTIRQKTLHLSEFTDSEGGSYSIEFGDNSLTPPNQLEKNEKEVFIQQAIDSLPQEQKIVVVLHDIEGLMYEEIVTATGLKLGTVKSKLSRAREKLKEKLKGLI